MQGSKVRPMRNGAAFSNRQLVAVLVPVLCLAACGSSGGKTTSGGTSGDSIKIQGFKYSPTPLTVSPGQKITVTNADQTEHTVNSDKSGAFKSGDVSADNGTATFTAPGEPGTYTYFCAYHSTMHGTLVVK